MTMEWGCVLLKGGSGSRMGNQDKSKLLWQGETFGSRIQRELKALGKPCFVSEAEGEAEGMGSWPSIPDRISQLSLFTPAGPMGGIWSCLRECCGERESLNGLFFVPCDMPFFRREMALYLAKACKEEDAVVWRTRDGRLHPVCAFYSKRAIPVLEERLKAGHFRMGEFLDRLNVRILDTRTVHIPDSWFSNVNSHKAYENLKVRETPPVLAVSGRKNTGKTALAEAIVKELSRRGLKTAVIKHDGHDFIPDVPGTDSYRMKAAGACGTAVYSDRRFSVIKEEKKEVHDFFSFFPEADLILLEGQKYSAYPKLETLRSAISVQPVCRPETVLAYVADWADEKKGNIWNINGQDASAGPEAPPVLGFKDMDFILELVIGFMDRPAQKIKRRDSHAVI